MNRKHRSSFLSVILLVAIMSGENHGLAQTTYTIAVDQSKIINPNAKKLLGISFDSRASMNIGKNNKIVPAGYYDPTTGTVLPGLQALWNRVPIAGVRYPGNPVLYNWNWKYTIGPVATRTPQPLGPNMPPQSLVFGFDEFMALTAARGLSSSDVQIMVVIYPSASEPNPAQAAADWVEYANAPNDGSNPGGGIDWAAKRAANGHPTPYNIRTWNIGNEPWTPKEFNFDATKYIPIAVPIIDAMLSIDPTIHITLPSVGNATSKWNRTLLNSASLAGKFYGLSPHSFYDEDASTANPSVAQVQAALSSLAAAAQAKGLKVIIGDHAHYAPAKDPDKAMRWQGALATADFLLMASQLSNIELANFWIYGMPKAVWHPIRQNANGTYTLMAAAQLYETLLPVFGDQSLQTTVANASGGSVASVRASAFKTNDGASANVVVVNTGKLNAGKVAVPNLAGFSLQSVDLITAALSDDTSKTAAATILSDGAYLMPPAGVLIFRFKSSLVSLARMSSPPATEFVLQQNYPNPFNPSTEIRYALPSAGRVTLVIYNTLGERVKTLVAGDQPAGWHSALWDGANENGQQAGSGIYYYRLTAGNHTVNRKMLLIR